jgi:hypothetical protein
VKTLKGNKSPDIYDGNGQRSPVLTGHEAQGSSLERSKEGRTLKCPKADKAVAGSNCRRAGGGTT